MVVEIGFNVFDSSILLIPFNLLISLSVEDCKRITEERKKQRCLLNFNFILEFNDYFVARRVFLNQ